jgi:tetratricopeptide (TPR) repeat protein
MQVATATASGNPPLKIYRAGVKEAPESLYLRRNFVQTLDLSWGPDLYAPKWLRYPMLRQLVAVVRTRMLLLQFTKELEQEAAEIPTIRRVVRAPLYGRFRDDLQAGRGDLNTLIFAMHENQKAVAYYFAGESSMASEGYQRAVAEFNAALQPGDMWRETILKRVDALHEYGRREHHFPSYVAALRDLRSLLEVDTHDPGLLKVAARLLWEVPIAFPDHIPELAQLWDIPDCPPSLANPRHITTVKISDQAPGATVIYCAVDALLERATTFGAFDFDVHEMRGRLHFFGLRQPATALEEFKKAVEIYPTLPSAWASYGKVLKEMGDCDGAADAYRRYTQLCTEQGCPSRDVMNTRLGLGTMASGTKCSPSNQATVGR